MFIRTKVIKGQQYGYAVQNSWTEKGARQKVTGYLGKVHRPQRTKSKGLAEFLGIDNIEEYFNKKSFSEIVDDLVKLEMHNHGIDDAFYLAESHVKKLSGKSAVIQANQGFICSDTVKQLKAYNPEQDEGYSLANLITSAGINIEKDVFVMLFGKVKAQSPSNQSNEKQEFYY